jgi:hypothetical protein
MQYHLLVVVLIFLSNGQRNKMPSNTFYNPQNIKDFEKTKLTKDASGISGIALAGQVTNLDYTLTDDSLLITGKLLVSGASQGDKVSLQILAPNNTPILQFITDWFVDTNKISQDGPVSNYPAKLTTGLKIRLIYTSTGASNVWVALNIDKEKVLE